MGRRVIRLGDPTTHGGKVVSATTGYIMFGKEVAGRGDKVTCPRPGHGVVTIVEGDPVWTVNGKNVALEGHKCSCGCSLISTLPNVVRSYEGSGSASAVLAGSAMSTGRNDSDRLDEQFRAIDKATGTPIEGQPYRIETSEGRVYSGTTDENGKTVRVSTTDPKQIKLYWVASLPEDQYPDADDEGSC